MNRNAAAMMMVGLGALYFMAKAKSAAGSCSFADMHGAFWMPTLLIALPLMLPGCGYFALVERAYRSRVTAGEPIIRTRRERAFKIAAWALLVAGLLVVVGALLRIVTC